MTTTPDTTATGAGGAPADEPVPTPAGGRIGVLAGRHPVGVVWLATVVFSAGPVLVAEATIPGVVFAFWRLWIGVVLLGVVVVAGRRLRLPRSRRAVWGTLVAGACFGAHQASFMAALRTTSVVDVTLMNTVAPIVVGVLAVPVFGERPGPAFRLWSVVAMAGAAIVALAGSTGPDGNPVGIGLAAAGVLFYALFFVGSKRVRDGIDTWVFLWLAMAVAALVVSTLPPLLDEPLTAVTARDLALCLAVAVGPGLVGHYSMTWSLKWVPANLPPVVMLTIPAFSGVLAWFLLGQGVTVLRLVGGLVTVIGVAGAVRSPGARRTGAPEALEFAGET